MSDVDTTVRSLEDQEWEILFNFQQEYRLKAGGMSAQKFLVTYVRSFTAQISRRISTKFSSTDTFLSTKHKGVCVSTTVKRVYGSEQWHGLVKCFELPFVITS